MTKYSDDDLDRIEREAQALLDEAKGTLYRAEQLAESVGLGEGETVTEFLRGLGPSEELDKLREEHIADLERELLEEEKILSREVRRASRPASARRRMARV